MSSKIGALFLVLVGATWSGSAIAQAIGLGLAQAKNCIACHQVNDKRVGPAFAVIAQRFEGKAGAVDYLANSIRNGSRARWGAIPMPAQRQVNEDQAKALATWILSLNTNKTRDGLDTP